MEGQTSLRSLGIRILSDSLPEDTETFYARLVAPRGGVELYTRPTSSIAALRIEPSSSPYSSSFATTSATDTSLGSAASILDTSSSAIAINILSNDHGFGVVQFANVRDVLHLRELFYLSIYLHTQH